MPHLTQAAETVALLLAVGASLTVALRAAGWERLDRREHRIRFGSERGPWRALFTVCEGPSGRTISLEMSIAHND